MDSLFRGLSLSKIFVEFLSDLYNSPCFGKIFSGVKITGKCISDSKYWIYSFLFMSPSKTPRFLLSHPRQKQITKFAQVAFFENLFVPSAEREEGKEIMELKKWSMYPSLYPSLFHVLLCHNLDSIMLIVKVLRLS